ncbi:unnamed protein product [Rotaria sordida]|uniref:C2H2-type domain-containing protein n=1 Tax=Rotaria sordida TaxID=392033 RepID=A0A815XLI6_9BILA|nr:unnamed protein product [Rotaria sordida]CAF1558922.1 unnamed protein product [Rotaria sordida]
MILRKASEIGPGRSITFSPLDIPINMKLVESFEPSNSNAINIVLDSEKKKRTDRKHMSFFFCSNDSCSESFQSEDDLITHESIGQHTTKDNHFSANDAAKILLFDKMRASNPAIHSVINTTTTSNSPIHLPKNFSLFENTGWASRTHKPSHRIDKAVKEYIQKIYEEEKVNGQKLDPEEYVRRIRSARNLDETKLFTPSQYLTVSQVRTHIRQLANKKSSSNRFDAMSIGSATDIRPQQVEQISTISVSILTNRITIHTTMVAYILQSSSTRSSHSKQITQVTSKIHFELDGK